MWDERYASDDFFYGTEPNDFLKEQAHMLVSPVLSIAEGEGRNAVYMASLGHHVRGVDGSSIGLAKAVLLAVSNGVVIDTEQADLASYNPPSHTYGTVVSVFAHLPSTIRKRLYPLLVESLIPGGVVLMEAYSEAQIHNTTGGPKDLDMLMSVEKVTREFTDLETLLLHEVQRSIVEGTGHTGMASVVQYIGRKQ